MLKKDQLEQFEKDGFLIIENFLSLNDCDRLRAEIENIIEKNNFVEQAKQNMCVINEDKDYFLTSNDKIRPFLEKQAVNILKNDPQSKNIFNKIGHALHALNPVFKEISFSNNIRNLFKSLGYKKPLICQSMYIFKQPFIGDEVQPHQDSSYLHTDPLKLTGIWFALEDCTMENGCLSFIPGSHKLNNQPNVRFIRNPNKEEFESGKYLMYDKDQSKYDPKEFVPQPVKAGSAVLIDGLVVHQSEKNMSSKSRHIYTFHVYESEKNVFSKENWIQYSPISFLPLYEN